MKVMLLTDYPTEQEERRNDPYSSPLNVQALEELRKASLQVGVPLDKSLHYKNINCVYLSDKRPTDDDPDYAKSIVTKNQIPAEELTNYVKLEWLKDIWVHVNFENNVKKLLETIEQTNPQIIICGGKWSFLLLTNLATIATTRSTAKSKQIFGGLNKYRGSVLINNELLGERIIFPIFTPKEYWAVKDKEQVVKLDYFKIAKLYKELLDGKSVSELAYEPQLNVTTQYDQALNSLNTLLSELQVKPTFVSIDVETRQRQIDCIGLCWNNDYTVTIPFTEVKVFKLEQPTTVLKKTTKGTEEIVAEVGTVVALQESIWTVEEEANIMHLLLQCMSHPNCLHIGQNYSYDCQYYYRNWKFLCFPQHDTMILHHVLYNYLEKSLGFLASMYVDGYRYWKDEIDVVITKNEDGVYVPDNMGRWLYNGKDVYYTLVILNKLLSLLEERSPELQNFYNFQISEVAPMVVAIMHKGVRIDVAEKERLLVQFKAILADIEQKFNSIIGQEVNLKSSQQVKSLFKDLLGVIPRLNKKTKKESFGAAEMLVYLDEYPTLKPLLALLLEYKSIGVFVRNFLSAKLDVDNRMRCSYNVAGTDTYRFASRKNAFDTGTNLQNVPSKGKIDIRFALQELEDEDTEIEIASNPITTLEGIIKLPNVKKIFLPDVGYVFWDIDYSSADAQFVAWDSDCKFLKDIFKARQDLYSIVASHYYQREITKKDKERQIFKAICHGSNYLGKAPMLAAAANLSISMVQQAQNWYFKQCPEVKEWHYIIEHELVRRGLPVSNIWGAEGWFTDFNDHNLINKAVAYIPQSSVGILVNKGLVAMMKGEFSRVDSSIDTKDIRSLLIDATKKKISCDTSILGQTHDSGWGQFHSSDVNAPARLVGYMELEIPYPDKLIIPAGIKFSPVSYGDCD